MRGFFFDVETCSALDLGDFGSWLYARHLTTDIRCASYCLVANGERGPIETWWSGEPVPSTILDVAADSDTAAVAFNSAFDRQIWEQILAPRYGWPSIPLRRHRCAQAATLARALPGSLDGAAAALKIATRKTAEGAAAMKRLASPRRQSAKERKAGAPLDFSATPEELATLGEYNRHDVLMTTEIIERIGLLSDAEQALWQLDQQINERGVHIDVNLLESALLLVRQAGEQNREHIAELTGGTITTPKQRDRILGWLKDHDCVLPNLAAGTVADALLDPGLTAPAQALLKLRQGGAGAAALKLATLRRWAPDVGEPRIRFAYRFHGASPGRFTSLGVQLHNLRKPELTDVRKAIEAVATGSLAQMRARGFDRPLETVGHVTRAMITASPGKRLFIADLSGIEARGAAYLVGANVELEQWRTFDRTSRLEDDPYYRTGISTFAQASEKARKAGKTGALAFQYQGGIGAYRRVTGDIETADEVIASRRDAWRRDHPEYVQFWRLAVFQAVQAIRNPGQEFSAKAVSFKHDHKSGFLEVTLPSGRRLTYPQAEIIEDEQYGTVSFTFLDASGSRMGRMYHERRGSGVFGGLLLENVTQALCRDIFIEAMPRLEAAGYAITMHTHDEFVCEVPEDFGSLDEFLSIITVPPRWAPNLPVAAKGRVSDRLIEIVEPAKAESAVADNVIDNATADEPEGAENDEDETADPEPAPGTPPGPRQKSAQACLHCRRDQIDGLERVDAHNSGWLHPECVDAFLRARMAEEGAPWDPPNRSAQAPPPPPTKGPNSNGAPGEPCPEPPPLGPSNGRGDGYPHGENAGPSAGPTVEAYLYRNAAGRLHMRVDRKVHEQRDKNGKRKKSFPTAYWHAGDWVWGWPKEVVPYRLPELLAAPPDALVLIAEGENGANAGAQHGYTTTSNPGGADKWQPELAQYFQGKQRVCIVEDNDAAGAEHTALVLKALRGVVPEIGVLQFPELPPSSDLVDYFAEGGTKQALDARIERAMKASNSLSFTLENLDGPISDLEFLWPGHFPLGAIELSAGQVSIGKSLVYCDFCAIITTGRDWPDGTPGSKPGNVLILSAEDRVSDYKRRLAAAGADRSRVKMLSFVRRDGRDELFELDKDLDKLEQAILHLDGVRLVIIDPITAYMGHGNGFDSHRVSDVRSQLHPLTRLAEKLDIPFGLVTHPPKNASARTVLDNYIGSQAFIAAARVGHYFVEELGEEDDRGFRRPTGRIFFITPKTSHSARASVRTLAFRIEDAPIGWNAKKEREIRAPRVVWEKDPIDLTADEAVQVNKFAPSDRRKARSAPVKEFLRDILASGPVPQKIVVERGAAKGISYD
jgi:DNA polymerase bacteriophage-type